MSALKTFAGAAGPAVEEFMAAMPEQDRARIAGLLAAGNSLSMAVVIQADGSSAILFEAILSDGERRLLAHVCGQPPTRQ